MSEEFDKKDYSEEQQSADGSASGSDDLNRYEYHYNYQNTSRWQSDTEKYNSRPEPAKTEKKKKTKWWIPVVIGMAVLLAAITVGTIFGVRAISKYAQDTGISEQIREEIREELNDLQTEEESQSSGVVVGETGLIAGNTEGGIQITDVSDVVEEVMPSVVSITSRELVSNGYYWGFFNRGSQSGTQEVESGIGSGTIVGQNESELLILTSYHVVEGSSSLYVTFCDESAVDGYIKAASESDDIAVVALRLDDISQSTLEAIKIAKINNDDVAIGDGVIVIGNALGYGQSVTTGIVSAKDRQITVEGNKVVTTIQTDAAINNGNSGGCMLNANGELIGISEAKISNSAVEGMCYAISIHTYYDKISDMLEMEPADESTINNRSSESEEAEEIVQSAYLGVRGYEINEQLAASYGLTKGVYVMSVNPGSGAEEAGITQGDIITAIDGKTVSTMAGLRSELATHVAGDKVTLTIMKYANNGYQETEVDVVLTADVG